MKNAENDRDVNILATSSNVLFLRYSAPCTENIFRVAACTALKARINQIRKVCHIGHQLSNNLLTIYTRRVFYKYSMYTIFSSYVDYNFVSNFFQIRMAMGISTYKCSLLSAHTVQHPSQYYFWRSFCSSISKQSKQSYWRGILHKSVLYRASHTVSPAEIFELH